MRKDRHKQDDEVAGDGKVKKDSTTNILMPDTAGLPQKSHVHALRRDHALTPRGRPTQDQAGGFNVVADQYTCSLVTVCNEVNPITLATYDEYLKGWND